MIKWLTGSSLINLTFGFGLLDSTFGMYKLILNFDQYQLISNFSQDWLVSTFYRIDSTIIFALCSTWGSTFNPSLLFSAFVPIQLISMVNSFWSLIKINLSWPSLRLDEYQPLVKPTSLNLWPGLARPSARPYAWVNSTGPSTLINLAWSLNSYQLNSTFDAEDRVD